VAKKYLNPNQLVLDYIPTLETAQIKPLRTTKNNYSIHPNIYNRNMQAQDRTQPKPGHPPVVNKPQTFS
jgi:hypothetical protein